MNDVLAWIDGDRIITRNSDGGTSGWELAEADKLSRALTPLIYHLNTRARQAMIDAALKD